MVASWPAHSPYCCVHFRQESNFLEARARSRWLFCNNLEGNCPRRSNPVSAVVKNPLPGNYPGSLKLVLSFLIVHQQSRPPATVERENSFLSILNLKLLNYSTVAESDVTFAFKPVDASSVTLSRPSFWFVCFLFR